MGHEKLHGNDHSNGVDPIPINREDHEPGNITAGTSILLPGGLTYTLGTKILKVYWNGRFMREGATKDYQEVDTTHIKFNFDLIATDNVDYIT